MPTSTLTSKGQTTIPKNVREFLRLRVGDRLEFIIDSDGKVVLRAATADLTALDGMLDRSGQPPVPVEAMHKAVQDAVSDALDESA